MPQFKHLLVSVSLLLSLASAGKTIDVDLSAGITEKKVRITATNLDGHYKGKTTALSITNITGNDLKVTVDLGIILRPSDSTDQPMVLAGGEIVLLGPNATKMVEVMTFCGNSPMDCPDSGAAYAFSHKASDTLVHVLKFIKTYSLYNYVGQNAVWVITNGKDINTINNTANPVAQQLVALLCELTGRKKPDLYVVTQDVETPGEAAYVAKPLQVIGEFTVLLEEPKTLTLGIFNERGEMIQKVFEDQEFRRAGHKFKVEFESADVPAGKYYLRLKEHDNVLQEKMVLVEQ